VQATEAITGGITCLQTIFDVNQTPSPADLQVFFAMIEVYGTQISLAEAYSSIWFNENFLEDARRNAIVKLRNCLDEWTSTSMFFSTQQDPAPQLNEQLKSGIEVLTDLLKYFENPGRDFFDPDQLDKNQLGSLVCL
jgi:hypothetical protein